MGKWVQLFKAVKPNTSCYNCCFYFNRKCLIPKYTHFPNSFFAEIKHNEMDYNKELNGISALVTSEQLRRLYGRLEDEATPYALRVSKGENHFKAITIYCDDEDVDYFTNILKNEI